MHVHAQVPGGPARLRGGTWPTPEELREVYDALVIEKGVQMPRTAPATMHGSAKQMCEFLDSGYQNGDISFFAYKNICRDNAINLLT